MSDTPRPFHNPFEALRKLRGEPDDPDAGPDAPASGPTATGSAGTPAAGAGRTAGAGQARPGTRSASPEATASEPARIGTIARAVVRIERSGRRGKDVTVIEHLGLPPGDLERWLRDLKAALGCGGSVEGAAIALQGDHRKRLPPLLAARGVRRVTSG